MKKLLLAFIFGMFLLSLASVNALDTYEPQIVNNQFSFCQTCADATYITLSSIKSPNDTIWINSNMTSMGGGDYCYNYTPQLKGTYDFRGISDGCDKTYGVKVPVNYDGQELTSPQISVYIISLIFLVFMALGIGVIISKLPNSDVRDDSGSIIQISLLKHLRPVLWVCIWALTLAAMYIIGNMGTAFLPSPMIGNLFLGLFKILLGITMIGVPLSFVLIIVRFFQDKEFKRMIERGVEMGGDM